MHNQAFNADSLQRGICYANYTPRCKALRRQAGSALPVNLALEVQTSMSPIIKLESALSNTEDVYVGAQQNAEDYFAALRSDIHAHICEPFPLSATAVAPGFPDVPLGSVVMGECVAFRDGYWLVYESEKDRFLCFWGADKSNLGAHGVFGSPLYCWSA